MCIAVFLWQTHSHSPFFLLLNRDEYLNRPTEPLKWWEDGEILGGRDGSAGGTWLASTRDGKVAFLTNFRELLSLPLARSRGDLPVRFLKSKKSPLEFAEEVVKEADQYNGFNLILADIGSKTMVYVTNRPTDNKSFVTEVSPGVHVLTNVLLDSPWPKARRLDQSFREFLNKNGDNELPIEEMIEKLMKNTVKDEESNSQREHQLSSIFVDIDSPMGQYGTRSISALSVKNNGEATFFEKHLENDLWINKSFTYKIENSLAQTIRPVASRGFS